MNTTNDVQATTATEAKTAQEGSRHTSGDRPPAILAGTWVAIQDITVSEDARVHSPEDIDSRAQSMSQEGQLQNILLSKEGDKLVLVYGLGRLLSAQKLGWEKIRADVMEGLSETQTLLMTLAENEERENASPFYTAGLYKRLMAEEKLENPGQLADKIGKDRSSIAKYLSLAEVPLEVQQSVNRFTLGLRHCLEIAKLPKPDDQVQLAQECAEKDLSVREVASRVKQLLNPSQAKEASPKPVELGLRFSWKGDQLAVRGLLDGQHGPVTLSREMSDALGQFMNEHPRPEPKEVAQAA